MLSGSRFLSETCAYQLRFRLRLNSFFCTADCITAYLYKEQNVPSPLAVLTRFQNDVIRVLGNLLGSVCRLGARGRVGWRQQVDQVVSSAFVCEKNFRIALIMCLYFSRNVTLTLVSSIRQLWG